ncbi:MAG: HlyC/CorC family transporter [Alphaproteobacteria bacterium]|nr:HlyC/CorC family transporter [Alphaproteobacteria bacterium]MBE8219788.1 HlyC/CorC family transporter [Alphaproteobacteria bacterium]
MADIISTTLIIILLLIFSAFLSGSETALTTTSRARMLQLKREGSRRARWVIALLEQKERLLGAILLGNNLVNILASVLATQLLLQMMGESGIFYATIIMTAMVVLFAEVLPKTYAILTPDNTALRAAGVLRVLVFILAPFTKLLLIASRRILRWLGFTDDATGSFLEAHEQIRGAIDLHHEEGGVRKGERDMLGGILDLHETNLDEIMVHRKSMQMIDADLSGGDMIKQILSSPYTRIPLWRDEPDNIIGILHAKDLLPALAATADPSTIDIVALAHKPWFVPETTSLREQLNAFRRRKSHFALVVDEYGTLQGMVTMEDILEEIVGNIDDEHDQPTPMISKRNDGGLEVSGALSIRDLNREMGWRLPDEEASSIAGLVIHEARAIPDVGQVFEFHGFRFQIISRQRNQIMRVRIAPTK